MRIQNNLTARNTHRQYEINNEKVAKAAEKLSSGYRVNRAADDAAGLAISEKMRSQIRGLNMAAKNSQDAISLVQTAEGALQESHAILQRMNEIAVQAATGTNQEFDRSALAKEFTQLKREINDIAEQTTFNNMPILDGSMSHEGYARSAQTSGITWSRTDPVGETGGSTGVTGPQVELSWEQLSFDLPNFYGNSSPPVAQISNTDYIIVNNTKYVFGNTVSANEVSITWPPADGTKDAESFAKALSNAIGKEYYFVTFSDPSSGPVHISIEGHAGKVSVQGFSLAGTTQFTPISGNLEQDSMGNYARIRLNDTDVAPGLKIQANGKTYVVTDADHAAAAGEIGLDSATVNTVATLAAAIRAKDNEIYSTADGNTIYLTLNAGTAAATTDLSDTRILAQGATGSAQSDGDVYTHTMEFDTVKMKDGDTYTITVLGESKEFTFDSSVFKTTAGQSQAEAFALHVAREFGHEEWAKGGAITLKSADPNALYAELHPDGDITKTDADAWHHGPLRIQVGALENEQLTISIDSMNTKGLELDDANLSSQNEAGSAITAVRKAVNRVSDQRATLGAMQNRLEHKIANLKVSSENLAAAESRIRDVDMASEMTEFTKSNILSQAATAMLAQANALPQNVLSLLG